MVNNTLRDVNTEIYTYKKTNVGYSGLCTKGLKIVLGFSGNYKPSYLLGIKSSAPFSCQDLAVYYNGSVSSKNIIRNHAVKWTSITLTYHIQ